jgi:hypothetical protein
LARLERERDKQSREGERKSRDDTAFRMATRMDSADAYRAYLDGCADDGCGHRAEVQAALSRLERSPAAGSPDGDRVTLEQVVAKVAREQGDKDAYEAAARADSETAYRQYLGNCHEHGCGYHLQASSRLAALQQREREQTAGQAEERRRQAPVAKLRSYFSFANSGQVDAALACLNSPRALSRKILESLTSVQLHELGLQRIGSDRAYVLLDWTGTTRDGKTERYRGQVPMVLRHGEWRIESFGQMKPVK